MITKGIVSTEEIMDTKYLTSGTIKETRKITNPLENPIQWGKWKQRQYKLKKNWGNSNSVNVQECNKY